jgi:phytoene dehydrogenase-like protein
VSDVLVVGGGLAGLACARELTVRGLGASVVEAGDAVGGRVRTDAHDGFLLDRGFQVHLTAYPEAQRVLDHDSLDLRPFTPGALVRRGGTLHRVGDPLRRPQDTWASALAPIGSLGDKLRIAMLRRDVARGSVADILARPETTTLDALRRRRFSEDMIDRFLRPLFAGVLLDPDLGTSSRAFEFVFRMLGAGDTVLPATGMQAIPTQLAASLPADTVRLHARAGAVDRTSVTLVDGERLTAQAVVLAVAEPAAAQLLPGAVPQRTGWSVGCLYFAADEPPVDEPILVLDGEGMGPVNNLCVPSVVAPAYAPTGQHLVSASVLQPALALHDEALEGAARAQLSSWFGPGVTRWRHLRTDRIAHAQPPQSTLDPPHRTVRTREGVYLAGDHRDTASINGALVSGRRAAEAIVADLG